VGHGIEPNGVYDPGAIGVDGRQEHLEAYEVCQWASAALRRSDVSVVSETAMGASHDPDFIGSAKRANTLGVRVAVEVHFDFRAGVEGFSGLFVSDQGKRLASLVGDEFEERGLPRKNDVLRTGLFFLNATNMPALIPEMNVITNYSRQVNQKQGEALAAGICRFLGKPFEPGEGLTMPVDTGHEWRASRDDGRAIGPFDRLYPMLDQLGPLAGPERDMTITLSKKIT
jgi:N-acetylmuramoyl-L-alanine amidase